MTQIQAKVVAVANNKGGVGKSTIAHLLATVSARLGFKVALVDLDSQGAQPILLNIVEPDGLPRDSIEKIFDGADVLDEAIEVPLEKYHNIPLPTEHANYNQPSPGEFYLLSGHQGTANISPRDPFQLRTLLQPLIDRCDLVILDTGPTTSNLNVSALVAADYLLIPLKIGTLSFMGLRDLLNSRNNLIEEGVVERAEIIGLIPTMVRSNTALYQLMIEELVEYYGDLVWQDCSIPESVVWEEAARYKQTVVEYDPRHSASETAWNLVNRFLSKFERRKVFEIE